MNAKFSLSKAQINKLQKGLNVNISHKQIIDPSDKENHELEVTLDDAQMKKLKRNITSNKGYRLLSTAIQGGKLNLKKLFNSRIGKTIEKKVIRKVARHLNKKGVINNKYTKAIGTLGDNLIDNKNLKESEEVITGLGIGCGGCKGSQEAKEKMARIRAMRKCNKECEQGEEIEGGVLRIDKKGRIRGKVEPLRFKPLLRETVKNLKVMTKPFIDPKIALALATGPAGVPIAGAVFTANVMNQILKSKNIKHKINDKDVTKAMDMVSKGYEMVRGAPVEIAGGGFMPIT